MHLNCFFSPCKQSDVDIITVRGKYKTTMPTFDLYLKKTPKLHPEFLLVSAPSGDSTSVATEYSLKFDESMTEDEIEERSFRSLLPSEAHRRGTMEKKSRHHEESEDDGANHSTLVSGPGLHNSFKVRVQTLASTIS